jgi:hypothetical protein
MAANIAPRADDEHGRELYPVPQMRSMRRFFSDVAEQRVVIMRGDESLE